MKTNTRKTLAMSLAIFGCAAANASAPAGGDPMQFPSYIQTVSAEFANAQAAKDAKLDIAPLPGNAAIACSCRWDDSCAAHLKKSTMMKEVGVKGSFYLVRKGALKKHDTRKLMDDGHAIGNHTISHKHMEAISHDAAFREIMEQRVCLEKDIGRTVTSYVSPFGWKTVNANDADAQSKVRHMRSVLDSVVYGGHFVSQDGSPRWSRLDKSTWMWTNRFNSDDRHPNRQKFVEGFTSRRAAALSNGVPRVTLGTHSWCNDEGTANQGKWLKEFFLAPDAVQMNDWEYGAYRYSFIHGSVRKISVNGNIATFEVKRYHPAFIGDEIPLSLLFSEKPVSVKATTGGSAAVTVAKGERDTWTLPHDAAHTMPKKISDAFPGLDITVDPDEANGSLSVSMRNATGGELSDVTVVAVLPPKWNRRRCVEHCGRIAAGETHRVKFDCDGASGLTSQDEKPYYPVSIDFSVGGSQIRVWHETR